MRRWSARCLLFMLLVAAALPAWAQGAPRQGAGEPRVDDGRGAPAPGEPAPVQPGAPALPEDDPARERLGPRPVVEADSAQVEVLLREIEAEARERLPLFGQRQFYQRIADRPADGAAPPADAVFTPAPGHTMLPGDIVEVTFWNAYVDPRTVTVTVQADGMVAFDPVGSVPVSGLTRQQFEQRLSREIRLKGPRNAQVEFAYRNLHTLRVTVSGEVRRVRSMVLTGYATLFDALVAAGGPRGFASLRRVRVYRDGGARDYDLYPFLLEGDPSQNPTLRDGDSIHVPVADRLVAVEGEVVRPARYEMTEQPTVAQALALAGGVLGDAARVQVVRTREFETRVMLDLAPAAVLAGTADLAAVEPLRNGDRVHVLALGEQVAELVEVEGAVGREGEYGFRADMTLGELVRLAQGVLRQGHGAVGYIRRVSPTGEPGSVNFTVAELLAGGPAAAIPLRPGDRVVIPRLEDRPPLQLMVQGAVAEPGLHQTQTAVTVSDALAEAGGLAPGADLAGAVLYSTAGGRPTQQRIDLSAVPAGGEPVPNPVLAHGDRLDVPFLQIDTAQVQGFVRNPGEYTVTAGLRVADLLERAGGLLPRAATRAKLERLVPGTNETDVAYIDLEAALSGDEAANVALRDGDVLYIDTAAAVLAPQEPEVTVTGPVRRPGPYPRYRGMTVEDLIREAGGLLLEADQDIAFLRRIEDNGRSRMIRLSPARAMAGAEESNLALQSGDLLEIVPWTEIRGSEPTVRISGAVYRPGPYALTEDLTVDDLLVLAGGLTPEAFERRAELYRRTSTGRPRVIALDLRLRPVFFPLKDGDELHVYTHGQAEYTEATVEIKGDVQRPGMYVRSEDMLLTDLLFMAGGPIRDPAFMQVELARARGTQTYPIRPDLERLLAGDEAQNVALQDGDIVYVRTIGDYLERPREVLVRGQVKFPSFYPITAADETIKHLITERAGGVLEGAFVEGAILLRRVDEVVHPEVARYASEIFEKLTVRAQRDDYALIISRGGSPDSLRSMPRTDEGVPTDEAASDLDALVAPPDAAAPRLASDVARLERLREQQYAGAADSATFEVPDWLRSYVRVAIDLTEVLEGDGDLRLRPNDILIIPERPQTILVQGEVASSLGVPFVEGQQVAYYLEAAGGVTRDADLRQLLLVRANGRLANAGMNTLVQRGDVLLVPRKQLTLPRERNTLQEIGSIASVLGGLATTIIAISNVL